MQKDLIIIEQLPVIVTKLKGLSNQIKKKTADALSLVCDEDSVRTVKAVRAELNHDKAEIEALRKEIKAKVMKPYEDFEAVYKQYITDIYEDADKQLKERIDTVENSIKADRRKQIKEYFDELAVAAGIDFVTFDMANINITLTASDKALKDACYNFLHKVSDELDIIDAQDNREEVLYEYKKDLLLSKAIMTVADRHRELDKKPIEEVPAEEVEPEEADKPLSAPTVTAEEKEYTMTFTVKGTRTKLKMVKEFLEKEGIDYE